MANNREGRIEFDVRLNNDKLRTDAQAAMAAIRRVGDATVEEGERMDNTFRQLGGRIAAVFTVQQAAMFVKEIVRVRGEIESLELSFETLLGNRGKAEALMSEIKTFASSTPMQLGDLAKGAQTLLGFNVEAQKVMPVLRQIGDISMGSSEKFNSLILAFSQMSSTGKLMGQDLLQMINAGFNPLVTLSEMSGKSIAALKDEMSAGAISAEMVASAFASAAGEGGKFYGMLEKQSQGIQGSMASLQSAIGDMFNELGTESQGIISSVISSATEIVKHYKTVGETLAVVVGMYGAYKAAIMTNAAVTAAVATSVTAAADAEIAALVAATASTDANAYADITAAQAAGYLTKAKAAELITLRQEALAKLEGLKIARLQAKADLESAETAHMANLQKQTSARAVVAQREKELAIARASGDARKIEIAETNLLTASRQESIITGKVQASAETQSIARSKVLAANKAVETLSENINTAAKHGNTAATGTLAKAYEGLLVVMKKLKVAMATNAYALALAGVVALGYGIYKLITHQTEAEKMQKKLNETLKEGERNIESERIQVEILFNRLKQAKEGTQEWDAARKSIMSKYGEYLKNLGDEKTALNDVAKAYTAVIEGVKEAARAKAMEKAATEAAETLAAKEVEVRDNIRKKLLKKEEYKDDPVKLDDIMVKFKLKIEGKELSEEVQKELDEVINSFDIVTRDMYQRNIGTSNILKDEFKGLQAVVKVANDTLGELWKQIPKPPEPPTFDPLKATFDELQSKIEETKKEYDSFLVTFNSDDTSQYEKRKEMEANMKAWQAEIEKRKAEFKDIGQQREEARKAVVALQKELDDLLKGRTKANDLTVPIAEKGKELVAAQKKLNLLLYGKETSDKPNKQEKQEKDTAEEIERTTRERIRTYEDAEHRAELARAALMEEGIDKELRILEINHSRKIQEIKRQEEDLRRLLLNSAKEEWEARNPNWKEEGLKFNDSQEHKDTTAHSQIYVPSQIDPLFEEENAAYEKTKEEAYKKELANYEKYAQQYINDYTEFQKKMKVLKEQGVSESVLSEFESEFNSQLSGLDETMGIKEEAFIRFVEGIASLGSQKLEDQMKMLLDELNEAKNNLKEANSEKDIKKIERLETQIRILRGELKKATDNPKKENDVERWDETVRVMGNVKKAAQTISEGFEGISERTRDITEAIMVTVDVAVGMITNIKSFVTSVVEGIRVTAKGGKEAISAVEKASVMLTVISTAIQLVTKIVNLFSKLKDKKREKEIQTLQGQVDTLQDSYERLGKAIDKAYSTQAAKLIEAQDANLRQQRKVLEEQKRLEEEKKKTDDSKVQQYKDAIKEIDDELAQTNDRVIEAITGTSVKAAIDEFAEAYIDAWAAGEDRAKAMKDVVKDVVKTAVTTLAKSKIDKEVQAFMDKLKDAMEDDILTAAEEATLDMLEASIENRMNTISSSFDKYIKEPEEPEEDTRKASSKGLESISQDSANELNGRFAGIQALVAGIETGLKSLIINSALALKHLAGIESNTQSLSRLEAIEDDISLIKTGINDINLKGLLIRKA
jgi:tape measure domain-containing protein